MTIYVLILLYLMLISFCFKYSNLKKRNNFLIFLNSSVLIIIYTIRSENVGWDTSNYIAIFEDYAPQIKIFDSYLEPGWILLNKIIYMIIPKSWFFFLSISSICILLWSYVLKNLSLNIGLSFVILYMLGIYFNLMNQQRNMLAISITLLSFLLYYRKKYIKSLLLIIIASMFHKSALIFLLFYFTVYISRFLSRKIIYVMLIVFVLIYLNFESIFNFLTTYFYSVYVLGNTSVNHINNGNAKMLSIHLLLVLLIVFADLKLKKRDLNHYNLNDLKKMLYMAIGFSLMLDILSLKVSMISRFSNYFSIYFIILIPNVLEELKSYKNRVFIKSILLVPLFIYMIIYLRFSENGFGRDGVIPYQIDISNKDIIYLIDERGFTNEV